MRTFNALKISSVQQIVSLTLGYPALLIYLGIALSETLNHNPWTWSAVLLSLYLVTIVKVAPKPPSRVKHR